MRTKYPKFIEVKPAHSSYNNREVISGIWPVDYVSNNGYCSWYSFSKGKWHYESGYPDSNYSLTKKTNPNAISGGMRADNYIFLTLRTGKKVRVIAGCHNFSFKEAKKHWSQPVSLWDEDEKDRKRLNAWSLKTVDKMEAAAKERGWIK